MSPLSDTKAERRAARAFVGTYHQAKLADLIEHVREALGRYDAGEIDVFELDDVIHHYERAGRELWKFCDINGVRALHTARTLEFWQAEGELPDWWEAGASKRRC